MRKAACLACFGLFLAVCPSVADTATRQKLIRYFGVWYSYYPGSRISVTETKDVEISGLETFRVERHSDSKIHQESNVALYDRGRDEVFVGEVMYDADRRAAARPFDEAKDLDNVRASLREAFGLPVEVALGSPFRGELRPFTLNVRMEKGADVTRMGFLSRDGSALLLGEFRPAGETATAFREKLLKESAGVGSTDGRFTVTEFLDFQCERCRVRTPDVRKAVAERGGSVEVRFLPLVKQHDWAFAAAECAAALAAIGPELYKRYEETIFGRQDKTDAASARQLAGDIAEAAGAKEKFEAEMASGRPRERIVRDSALAMRLGISGTPSFLYGGTFVSGEKGLLESLLWERLPAPARRTPAKTE